MPETDRSELTSWKEIADYLSVTVRTAQTWEKSRGLPVRRMPGQRARVYALPPELDRWRGESDPSTLADPPAASPGRRLHWAVALGMIAALAGILVASFRTEPSGPASYSVTDTHVVVFGEDGRELWRRVAEFPKYDYNPYGLIHIQDLDGDGVNEVLAVEKETELFSARLVCYGADGKKRWTHRPRGKVRTRVEEFTDSYGILSVVPIQVEGIWRIFVSAEHTVYYPCQIISLSADGKVLQHYWHSGHIRDLVAADVNRDGKQELYAGGVSNSWKRGTLLRFDPANLGGASVETDHPDYQLMGFGPGTELARVILPRTCLSSEALVPVADLRYAAGELVAAVWAAPATDPLSQFLLHTGMDLTPRTIGLNSEFVRAHEKGDHPWSKEEEARLLADVVRLK